MIANSHRQDLKEHLLAVALVSIFYVRKYFMDVPEHMMENLAAAAILHDIGKASSKFQKWVNDPSDTEDEEVGKNRNFHNEDSYLVVSRKLEKDPSGIIGWLVLHHHAPRKTDGKIKDAYSLGKGLSRKDEASISSLMDEMATVLNKELGISLKMSDLSEDKEVPSLVKYLKSNKKELASIVKILQTCLVTADRKVSEMSSEELTAWLATRDTSVFDLDLHTNTFPVLPEVSNRDTDQETIASKASSSAISVVNAPPGWGKTRASLRWLSHVSNNGPIFYVTPRNSVAESLYGDILEELRSLGISKKVQLFLTGEVQKSSCDFPQYAPDIIVTNIDSVLSPFISHGKIPKLIQIFKCPMVLDEFHEFASGSAMFCQIGTLIAARKRANSPTMLMSATPIQPMVESWILNDDVLNFSVDCPVYDNDISVLLSEDMDESIKHLGGSGCIIHNTVGNTQNSALDLRGEIIHGFYDPKDKSDKLGRVIGKWGKSNYKNAVDEILNASGIVQASLNISFSSMLDSVASPETTIQRAGRLGRFDGDPVKLVLFFGQNQGDRQAIQQAYCPDIRSSWVEFLNRNIVSGETIKRSRLLFLYQTFCNDNRDLYEAWIENLQDKSIEAMEDFAFINKRSSAVKQGPARTGLNLRGKGGVYVMVAGAGGEIKILSTESHRLRNLIDRYNQSAGDVSQYIANNRSWLASQGCSYPSDKKLRRYGTEEFTRDARSSDKPLLCLKEIWEEDIAVYHDYLGMVVNSDVLDRITEWE